MSEDPSDRRRGYRAPPPAAASRITWPDAFGTRFLVCVDTEEEFDWSRPLSREARGTTHMSALVPLHARFAAHGVPLTYLIDYPVATCPASTAILRRLIEDGRSTIGTQMHPWVNPPYDEAVTGSNSFAGNLPSALERAKLIALTEAIADMFERPLIYRAGRYGMGPETLALLHALGYRADTSMRAGYDYTDEAGPNFAEVPNHAFQAGPDGAILELPLTTMFTGRWRSGGVTLHRTLGKLPRARGAASRLGLLSRVALSPEDMPLPAAMEAVRVAVGEGLRLLNFSFHSPSAEPGHTPYVRDAADLTAFYRWWDEMFALLVRLDVAPASLAEVLEAACGRPPGSANAGAAGGL